MRGNSVQLLCRSEWAEEVQLERQSNGKKVEGKREREGEKRVIGSRQGGKKNNSCK